MMSDETRGRRRVGASVMIAMKMRRERKRYRGLRKFWRARMDVEGAMARLTRYVWGVDCSYTRELCYSAADEARTTGSID